jgi:hypothetical protein
VERGHSIEPVTSCDELNCIVTLKCTLTNSTKLKASSTCKSGHGCTCKHSTFSGPLVSKGCSSIKYSADSLATPVNECCFA